MNLDGAWFASSPPELTQQFETRFHTTYTYQPPRIASLAYDAVALAVVVATSGKSYDAATLTDRSGFVGPANGLFRLNAGSVADRGLAIIEIHGTTLRVIGPAQPGFTDK